MIPLESLQSTRDLLLDCVQDLMFLSRGDRDLGVAFQTHTGNQASSRGEAKDTTFLSRCDGYHLEPTIWTKGVKPPVEFGERIRDCSSGHAGKKALISP